MKPLWIVLSLVLYGLYWMESPGAFFGMWVFVLLYLYLRFKKIWVLVLFAAASSFCFFQRTLYTPQKPQAGEYAVTEIRSSYSIAFDGRNQVVVYDLEDPVFGDVYLLEEFEELYSSDNFYLFSFSDYMLQRKTAWSTRVLDQKPLRTSESLQAKVYRRLRDSDFFEIFQYCFYNVKSQDVPDWISSLGLPFMGFCTLAENRLRRFLSQRDCRWIMLALIAFYGWIFCWSHSLLRFFIFRLYASDKLDRTLQIFLSMMTYLIFVPMGYQEFCFVLPFFLRLVGLFPIQSWNRSWLQKSLLAFLQILYFAKLDPLFLIGFSMLRKITGFLFTAALVLLAVPIKPLAEIIMGVLSWNHWFSFTIYWGRASQLFILVMLAALFYACWKPGIKSSVALILALLVHPASFILDPFFHVYVLDIGQGDCTLIVEPFQKSAVMIDCAGSLYTDKAEKIILPFLQALRISRLDALIITHQDLDHSGSKEALLEALEIGQVIEDRNDEAKTLYPLYSLLNERESKDDNDESIVSCFRYDGFTYLWMGDASVFVEEQLLQEISLKADVLKLGHHGSATSSSFDFLRQTDPFFGVVSAGKNNFYGHPHKSVMEKLEFLQIMPLQTQLNGSIHFFSLPNVLFVHCADGTFTIRIQNSQKQADADAQQSLRQDDPLENS